jgi:hypothetical protein
MTAAKWAAKLWRCKWKGLQIGLFYNLTANLERVSIARSDGNTKVFLCLTLSLPKSTMVDLSIYVLICQRRL